MLVDLRPKRLTGKVAEVALGRAHITCNKNGIPFDPEKPTVTSGIRLGTPAGTTRGFGVAEFRQVGDMIAEVLDALSQKGAEEDAAGRGRGAREGEARWLPGSRSIRAGMSATKRVGGRMRCPSCASLDTQVKDSRPTEDSAAIRRRRVCLACNFRFTTFERVQLRELVVIKRNGRRVPFDRDKLMRSMSDRAAQAPGRAGAGRADGVEDRARAGKSGRERSVLRDHRRDRDGASARARRRRLCPLRLGLSQFPRGQGFRERARRTDRRGRAPSRAAAARK